MNKPEEAVEVKKPTITNIPNLKGDWLNFYLLLVLYILQGFPIGLSGTVPIILQSRQIVTYEEQVTCQQISLCDENFIEQNVKCHNCMF